MSKTGAMAMKWVPVRDLINRLEGVQWDWKRMHVNPYPRGAMARCMTPQRMPYQKQLGGNTLLWWNGQDADDVHVSIAFLQMQGMTSIVVLR